MVEYLASVSEILVSSPSDTEGKMGTWVDGCAVCDIGKTKRMRCGAEGSSTVGCR